MPLVRFCQLSFVVLLSTTVIGCGSATDRQTSLKSSDPPSDYNQQIALDDIRGSLLKVPAVFGRPEYNPTDVTLIERLIDPAIKKNISQRYFDKWPKSPDNASRVATTIAPNVWGQVLDDEAGRAAFEAQIRSYWDSPRMEQLKSPKAVIAHLGVTPGKIERAAGGYYTILASEFQDRHQLDPKELVRRLESLREDFPNCEYYQLQVITTPHLRDHAELGYRYSAKRDVLEVHQHDSNYESPEPIGNDLSRLVSGKSPVRIEYLKLLTKNTRTGPPR